MRARISITRLDRLEHGGWWWKEEYTDPSGDDVSRECFTDEDGCGVAYWKESQKGYDYESYDEVQLVVPSDFSLPQDKRRAYRKIRYRLERLVAGKIVEVEGEWFDEPQQRRLDAIPLSHYPTDIFVPHPSSPGEYLSVQESVRRGREARGITT